MKYCVSIFNFIKRCQPVADQHPIIYINDYHVTLYSARPTELEWKVFLHTMA